MHRRSTRSASTEDRFCDVLNGDLYERLNLLEPNNYHELVNKAISQEDAMRKAQKDRKRQIDFTLGSGSSKKFRFVKKNTPGSSQSSSSRRWRVTPSQNKPSRNFQYCHVQQQVSKPKALPPCICYSCIKPRHYANECLNPKQQAPTTETRLQSR
jgi:hypothetical protein